jgi:thermosome
MMQGQQVYILKEGTQREQGKGAHHNNIAAAIAIADTVRSTLGPRGMDKMMVDTMGDVIITNDGVTILKEIDVQHPAAKMMVEIAKVQDAESGDGTTTAVILAGELLKQAETLIDKNIHPTTITAGYKLASEKALKFLEEVAEKVDRRDQRKLQTVASTAMMSKSVVVIRDMLAEIAVRAVLAITEEQNGRFTADLDNISVVKKHGGSARDTQLVEGIIIDKEVVHAAMPRHAHNAKILLLDAALEIKKTEVDAKIEIHEAGQLQAFLAEEEKNLKKMAERIKESGATVVFCQKGIDDLVQYYLAKAKIYAARRCKRSDIEKLAKATGGNVISKLDDLSRDDLGRAGLVEERKVGDDRMTFVMECENAKAVSILLRGGTEHVVAEMERSLHDALSVISAATEDGKICTGGGSAAMEVALGLRDFASTVGGREQMAIQMFADAMEIVPRVLAENAGLDPINILIELRKAHKNGQKNAGVNVFTGKIVNMREENVIEPVRLGKQAIQSATEAASMILRIDDVIAAKSSGMPGGGKKPKMPDAGGED